MLNWQRSVQLQLTLCESELAQADPILGLDERRAKVLAGKLAASVEGWGLACRIILEHGPMYPEGISAVEVISGALRELALKGLRTAPPTWVSLELLLDLAEREVVDASTAMTPTAVAIAVATQLSPLSPQAPTPQTQWANATRLAIRGDEWNDMMVSLVAVLAKSKSGLRMGAAVVEQRIRPCSMAPPHAHRCAGLLALRRYRDACAEAIQSKKVALVEQVRVAAAGSDSAVTELATQYLRRQQ